MTFGEPRQIGKRVFDDRKFFESLRDQANGGRGLTVDQRHNVYAKRGLQLGLGKQVVQHHLWHFATAQLDDHAQAAAVLDRTPAALTAVATFYDMFQMEPLGRKSVYVCTNISCSLCGADELLEALEGELGEDPDVNLRGFECLGACDIAPMASVNGVYVGPIGLNEVPELARQIRQGADPLPEKQLLRRPSADPKVAGND